MKNEEIVKMLRRCDVKHCDGCPLLRKEGCVMLLKNEAADLIEKLTDRCARYAEEIAVLQEREKWVPVTERLPEVGKRVIVKDDIFCGEAYLSISGDWYRHSGILWENITDSPVTHWMPLPDGPEVE